MSGELLVRLATFKNQAAVVGWCESRLQRWCGRELQLGIIRCVCTASRCEWPDMHHVNQAKGWSWGELLLRAGTSIRRAGCAAPDLISSFSSQTKQ